MDVMWPLCLIAFRSLLLAGFTDFATCVDYKVVTHASSPLGRQETEGVWLQRIRRQVRSSKSELKITNYHVRSEIVSRYAITTVECSMWNPHSQAKEAIFEVELPGAAFISNFTITINNKVYVAEVKERATAKRIYEEAKKKGRTAGHVGTKERETEKFRLAINVEAESQMTFTLTYEELLQRRLGHYEVVLSVRPGQLVSNLTLELSISERTGISFLKVLPLRTTKLLSNTVRGDANMPPSTKVQQSPNCAHIRFTPTLRDQETYSTSTGIAGDFVVQYDVDLKDLIGDVQIYNGYFVHYFAPRGLPIIPKNVIFLIDVSGSMIGTKIKQTKNAMQTILSDLRPDDHFNIITFSDVVNIWNPNSTIQATPQNVKKAKDFVSKIVADGWTDINAALMMAGSILKTNTPEERSGKHRIPLVILLTDGEPTIGVTSGEKIAQNTKKTLNSTSLFGLAFGDDADFPLLRRLSMENRGVARRIYEDADAALQLSGFYDEVASPLLYDIQLNYLDNHVYDITQSLFPNYFQGSELVVAGRVQQDVKNLHVTMTGSGLDKNIALANDVAIVNPSNASFGCSGELERIPNFVHRLWAYFTIKELLRVRMNGSDPATQRLLMEKATNLSLKYNFVTPVTSLVIVKPDDNEEKSKQRPQKVTTNTTVMTTTTTATSANTHTPLLKTAPVMGHRNLTTTARKLPTPTSSPTTRATARFNQSKPIVDHPKSPVLPVDLPTTGQPFSTSSSNILATNLILTKQPAVLLENVTSVLSYSTVQTTSTSSIVGFPGSSTSSPVVMNLTFTGQAAITPPLIPEPFTIPQVTEEASVIQALMQIKEISNLTPHDTAKDLDGDQMVLSEVESIVISGSFLDHDMEGEVQSSLGDVFYTGQYTGQASLSQNRVFTASADGDPHFLVHLPKSGQNICFTINGQENDELRLVDDPIKGVSVTGHLKAVHSRVESQDVTPTYFDWITIITETHGAGAWTITITLHNITLNGEAPALLRTDKPGTLQRRDLNITVDGALRIWVKVAQNVEFLVLLHHYQHPINHQMDHLGIYISQGGGLSLQAHGLLGQFQHSNISIKRTKGTPTHPNSSVYQKLAVGELQKGNQRITVFLEIKKLKDTIKRRHFGKCWIIPSKDVEQLIDGTYQDYVTGPK
ncbi:inter-alpha-trypsin inhibitor heavy chain H6 isoform X2 [Polypterus senegalus]|uniref:inter-alpha-trypsin inhibitor heavy chain H6 isoform X2 n=1 Tax=Polypterus senegalus TaxID=55291 RepID=UPI0019669F14|nr:inter-alpha-trypsin inhibitor heavy chain H6 isoform X2 [Polypterus senegalus]